MWLATPAAADVTVWEQSGTGGEDSVVDLALDTSGYVHALIQSFDQLGPASGRDVVVRRFNTDGQFAGHQTSFGTNVSDWGHAIVSTGDDLLVAGSTSGMLGDDDPAGNQDAFVLKYSSEGTSWTEQFGTSGGDAARGVCTDGDNLYVVGFVEGTLQPGVTVTGVDAFIRKYSSEGNVLWTAQFGASPWDGARGCAVDVAGNVFVGGEDDGGTFLRRYSADSDGTSPTWEMSLPWPVQNDLAVAGGFVVLTGKTGGSHAYVAVYDAGSGDLLHLDEFGNYRDAGSALTISGSQLYVAGDSYGSVGDSIGTVGWTDAYVRNYTLPLTLRWTQRFGTAVHDMATAVAADTEGAYVGGKTEGNFAGTNLGDYDAFLARVSAPPITDPSVTEHPVDNHQRAGEEAYFWAEATLAYWAMTVQWQFNANSAEPEDVGWTDISGATSSDLSFTASTADRGFYRAAFTSAAGPEYTAYSNAAALTVADNAIVVESATVSQGQVTVTFHDTGTPDLVTFQCDLGHGKNPWVPCASGQPRKGGGKTVTVRSTDLAGHPWTYSLPFPITRTK